MTTFYIIRVAETQANVDQVLTNYSHITDGGKQQAEALGEMLKAKMDKEKIEFADIYCTEFSSTQETATIIASFFNMQPNIMPDFNEVNWGDWEGKKRADLQNEMDSFFQGKTRMLPNGEFIEDIVARTVKGLNKLSEAHPEKHVCIVGHGGTTRILVAYLLGMSPYSFYKLPGRNASITIFKYDPDRGALSFDAILYGGGLDCMVKPK